MRVLIVDDDSDLADELVRGFGDHGFFAHTTDTGRDALSRYADFEVVLLDVGLPDVDGYEVCRMIRAASNIPIIMISGRDNEFDRVLGLRLGADDYVAKPHSLRELVARIQAIMRRMPETPSGQSEPAVQWVRNLGPVRIDLYSRRVYVDEREILLSRKEFDLLTVLTAEPGKVISRNLIMCEVWGDPEARDTRTLGVHLASLRRKLSVPGLIETVRGIGFRVVEC